MAAKELYKRRLFRIVAIHMIISLFFLIYLDKYSAWEFALTITLFGWIYSLIVTSIFIKTLPRDEKIRLGKRFLAWLLITGSIYWTIPIMDQYATMKFNW